MSKSLEELFQEDPCYELRKDFVNLEIKKNKKIKILSVILVVLLISNAFFIFGFIKRDKYLNQYYLSVVNLSKNYIANACINVDFMLREDKNERKIFLIGRTLENLEAASDSIRQYSIYYNFNRKDNTWLIGNGKAAAFFRAFGDALSQWYWAYEEGDIDNYPSEEELLTFKKDLDNVAEKFSVYANLDYSNQTHIEELDYKGLSELFDLLASEIKSEKVKERLESSHEFNY